MTDRSRPWQAESADEVIRMERNSREPMGPGLQPGVRPTGPQALVEQAHDIPPASMAASLTCADDHDPLHDLITTHA